MKQQSNPLAQVEDAALYLLDLLNAPFSKRRKRVFQIRHTYSKFGKFEGRLSAEQNKLWTSTFDAAKNAFAKGEIALKLPTPLTNSYVGEYKVSVVMPRFIGSEENGIENDFTLHFSTSARQAGINCKIHYIDSMYRPHRDLEAEYAKLLSEIDEFRPNLLVFDGNVTRADHEFNARHIADLKHRFGLKTLCVVGDLYDIRPEDCLSHWSDCSDLFIIFNKRSKYYVNFARQKDVLVEPFLPFGDSLFFPMSEKVVDFYYCGARSRQRAEFVRGLEGTGMSCLIRFHDRTTATAVPAETYLKELASARITFANGYINASNNIITARVGESILSKTVVLYEDGSDLSDFFVPFVHYIPVQTSHDVKQAVHYLESNPSVAQSIADAAHSFWHEHYSSGLFWARLRALTAPAIDKGAS